MVMLIATDTRADNNAGNCDGLQRGANQHIIQRDHPSGYLRRGHRLLSLVSSNHPHLDTAKKRKINEKNKKVSARALEPDPKTALKSQLGSPTTTLLGNLRTYIST